MDALNDDDIILRLEPLNRQPSQAERVAAHRNVPEKSDISRGEQKDTSSFTIRWSHGAKTSLGVVGGCAANADLCLPDVESVSNYHFAITFDNQNRPVAKDLGSTSGIKVTYIGEKGQYMSNFDWPLDGPSIAKNPPILSVTDKIQFEVILPNHDYLSPQYIAKVERFRTGTADPDNLLADLIIKSLRSTRLPTGQQTPQDGSRGSTMPIQKWLGKGAFGSVTYEWVPATREEYVVKQPLEKLIKSRNYNEKLWRKEAKIMQSICHEHIVTFRGATFSPHPQLRFEYVRGGSLDNHPNLSVFESTQVLHQLSSALEYLHSRNPPIAHRDIKPENILVEWKIADGIRVKFADFGLSKAAEVLKTNCGTPLWAAPEIYRKRANPVGAAEDTYGVAVDIWSLGLVVASLVCGLPNYESEWLYTATDWARAVQSHVKDHHAEHGGELLYLVLDAMLVIDPDGRLTAEYITSEALKILPNVENEPNDEGSAATTPILRPRSVVESEGFGRDGPSDDMAKTVRASGWANDPDAGSRIVQTIEALPQGSAVDGLASFARTTSKDGSAATRVGTVAAQSEPPREEERGALSTARSLVGNEEARDGAREAVGALNVRQSKRKRSWPEDKSASSLARSVSATPSADPRSATSREQPVNKRSRLEGGIADEESGGARR